MNNPFNDKINMAVAEAARKVMEQTKKAEQIDEAKLSFVDDHDKTLYHKTHEQALKHVQNLHKRHGAEAVEDHYHENNENYQSADGMRGVREGNPNAIRHRAHMDAAEKVLGRKPRTRNVNWAAIDKAAKKQGMKHVATAVGGKVMEQTKEVEQIDELSDKTKTAYAAAAVADAGHKAKLASTAPPGSKMKAYADAKKKARLRGLSRPQMQANEEVNHFTLHAVHPERDDRKKKLGSFASKAEAAAHINKLEDSGKFPEGHEAVLTHNATGEKHVYTDKWEKLDEWRNIFEAEEEHVKINTRPHLHEFMHGTVEANYGGSREEAGEIEVPKHHADKAEKALEQAKQKGMNLRAAGASADEGKNSHKGQKIPKHALDILDRYMYEEFQQIMDESKVTASAPISSTSDWRNRVSYNNHFLDKKAAKKAAEHLKNHTGDGNYHVIPHPDGMVGYRITHAYRRQADVNKTIRNLGPILHREEVEQIDEFRDRTNKNAAAFKAGGGIAAARSGPISPEQKAAYVKAGRKIQKADTGPKQTGDRKADARARIADLKNSRGYGSHLPEDYEQIDEGGNYGKKYDAAKHIASMTNAEIEKRIAGWEEFKQKNPNMPHRVTHDQLAMLRAERASRIGKKKTNEEVEQTEEGYRPHHTNPKPGWALDPATKEKFAKIRRNRETKAKYVGKSIPKSDKMEEETSHIAERLIGRQRRIDANENGKIDAHDFELLRKNRKKSKMRKEELEQMDEVVRVHGTSDIWNPKERTRKHVADMVRDHRAWLRSTGTRGQKRRWGAKTGDVTINRGDAAGTWLPVYTTKKGKVRAALTGGDKQYGRDKNFKREIKKESYLIEETTPALSAAMKAILADAFHMYFKAHTFHWNVEGANFPEYHKFFGDVYEQLFDTIDPIAEEIRALGEYAPRSLTELKGSTSIDDSSVQTPAEMFGSLLSDNSKILAGLTNGYKVAEAAGEIGLSNFLQDKIDAHKKLGWMIKSVSKGA